MALCGGDAWPATLRALCEQPWPRVTFADALAATRTAESDEHDLNRGDEQRLVAQHGGVPVFVRDWPQVPSKPFYARRAARTLDCFDLYVADVGELIGGSVREERLDALESAMTQRGMKLDALQWYIDLRRVSRLISPRLLDVDRRVARSLARCRTAALVSALSASFSGFRKPITFATSCLRHAPTAYWPFENVFETMPFCSIFTSIVVVFLFCVDFLVVDALDAADGGALRVWKSGSSQRKT